MNLLFLTPALPYPPHQGTALRNWGLVRELAARHAITLLTFAAPGEDAGPVRQCLHEVVTAPLPRRSPLARLGQQLSPRPDLSYRLASRAFDAALRQLLKRRSFDAVQIEGLEMARALPLVRGLAPRARLVYDAHNVEYLLQRSAFLADVARPVRWPPIKALGGWPGALYSLTQWPRLRRFEAAVCRAADVVTCVSREDAAALRQIAPGVQPVVVPNGLRLADYPYSPGREPGPELAGAGARGERPLVFTGKLDYRPNVDAADWFVRAILPQVRATLPEVQFLMAGRNPHPGLLALTARPGVLLASDVPDIRPYIGGAAAYVMPLRMGGGTRFKLLEALALGAPVVSTALGVEGFAVAHERELLLADSAADFAGAVLRLLRDQALRQRLRQAGRAFVEREYDWSAIAPTMEAAYLGV